MSNRSIGPLAMAVCILTAFLGALAARSGLDALAAPSGFKARRASLTERVEAIERTSRLPGNAAAFRPGAVCDSAANPAAAESELQAAASAGVADATVLLGESGRPQHGLTPVQLELEAEASYADLMGLLDRMGKASPQVFVDQVDLAASGQTARLTMTGRVFCWAQG